MKKYFPPQVQRNLLTLVFCSISSNWHSCYKLCHVMSFWFVIHCLEIALHEKGWPGGGLREWNLKGLHKLNSHLSFPCPITHTGQVTIGEVAEIEPREGGAIAPYSCHDWPIRKSTSQMTWDTSEFIRGDTERSSSRDS